MATSELEKVKTKLREIEFWKSEYIKRKFTQDSEYNQIKDAFDLLDQQMKQSSDTYLSKKYTEDGKKLITALQSYFITTTYFLDNQNFESEFIRSADLFFRAEKNVNLFSMFYKASAKYQYFISDLFDLKNMYDIVKNPNSALPSPICYHPNHEAVGSYDDSLLSLFYFDRKNQSVITFTPQADPSPSSVLEKILQQVANSPEFKNHKTLSTGRANTQNARININSFNRCADAVIVVDTQHDNFDIDKVYSDIKYHLAWIVFSQKIKLNKELTDKEIDYVNEMLDYSLEGNYGVSYRESRAIGLFIWDKINKSNLDGEKKSISELIRTFKAVKISKSYSKSDERTIRRFYKRAEECIEQGKVLAINPTTKK